MPLFAICFGAQESAMKISRVSPRNFDEVLQILIRILLRIVNAWQPIVSLTDECYSDQIVTVQQPAVISKCDHIIRLF